MISIEEAIEINQYIIRSRFAELTQSEVDALTLGIEALRAIQGNRIAWGERGVGILPGETEE